MIKSYIAKTTINFVDFEFYVRPGDLMVHDTANHNRLTVYRNGQIVKIVKQEPLGLVAFLKNKFIEEVAAPVTAPHVVEASKVTSTPVEAPIIPVEPQKQYSKRDKAVPREVPIEEYYKRIGETPPKLEEESTTVIEN